ncbi:hypothetical protein HELRODRAFT_164183 [Helobdella robusta]|uniref:TROVE domain-containing protein n=1 Tax=Helobdella robusta TaxID=6412 RepID=T1EV22_HELRO|nr:hypothetical protein HELRODRAFT_164183 [Helobdella robusta]ESN94354.1 hypothetical protein HELRODRAFT_164183 [Helobdella robusta]
MYAKMLAKSNENYLTKLDSSRLEASVLKNAATFKNNSYSVMDSSRGLDARCAPSLNLELLEKKHKCILDKSHATILSFDVNFGSHFKLQNVSSCSTKPATTAKIKKKIVLTEKTKNHLKRKHKDNTDKIEVKYKLTKNCEHDVKESVFSDYDYENVFCSLSVPRPLDFTFCMPVDLSSCISHEKSLLDRKKMLVNEVSTSLIKSPTFLKGEGSNISKLATQIASEDPEFILKMALYCRHCLYIRSTSNFLLAFSANSEFCKPYLIKYFNKGVVLPTDWKEVAELALV